MSAAANIHPAPGTLLGVVMPPRILAGWPIVATGTGHEITVSRIGVCWGRYGHEREDVNAPSADVCWDAVDAYFRNLHAEEATA